MKVRTRLIKSALLALSLHSLEVQCGTVVETKGKNTLGTQINIETCYSGDCGNCDKKFWTAPQTGYWLSKFDAWWGNGGGTEFGNVIQGVQLTYVNALGQTVTSSLIGTSTGTLSSNPVTKFVNGVSVLQDSTNTRASVSCFKLYFDDNTSATVGPCQAWTEFKVVIDFNFVGLRCDLHQQPHGSQTYNRWYGCHVYNELGCPGTFDSRSVNNMTVIVGQSSTQDVTFFINQIPACGPRIYTFTPTYSFLSLSGPLLKTLTLSSSNPADEGTYSVSMNVKLQNFPQIPITKNFSLTIVCQVSTISFDAGIPASSIVRIGIDEPFLVSLPITKTPACGAVATYSISPAGLSFASIVQTGSTYSLRINGAVPSNKGLYSLTLTASQNGKSATKAFSLDLRDPCATATIIATPNSLTTMSVVMPSAGTQSQTFALTTDVTQTIPSIICNLVATITPASSWISLSPDQRTIIVNEATIALPTYLGNNSFSVMISSLEYPLAVTKTMNFSVQVSCSLTSFEVLSIPVDAIYTLNTGQAFSLPLDLFQINDCKLPYTYTTAVLKNGGGIPTPTWLIFDTASRKYSFNVSAPSEIGVYDITITATTSQLTHQETFKLTLVSECEITNLIDHTFRDMSTTVSLADDTQSLFFEDTVGVGQVNPTFCGLRTYTLSSSYPFLTILGDTLTLSSTNPLHAGTYAMTLTIRLLDFPSRPILLKSFTVHVYCVVLSLSFDAGIPTTSLFEVGINVQPFSSLPFSVTRSPACSKPPTFTLTPTSAFLSISTSTFDNGSVLISGATQSDHNTYSLTITATVDTVNDTHQFSLTIKDPCSTSVITTSPAINLTLAMPGTMFVSQTLNMLALTDVEQLYPSVICQHSLLVTPILPFTNQIGLQFSADGSLVTPGDIGVHNFTLQVTDTIFPAVTKSFTFSVTVTCQITSIVAAQSFYTGYHLSTTDPSYTPSAFEVPAIVSSPANCYTISAINYAVFDVTFGGQVPVSYATLALPSLIIDTQDPDILGPYLFEVVTTIPTTAYLTGNSCTVSYQIEIYPWECKTVVIYQKIQPFTILTQKVKYPAQQREFTPFSDTITDVSNFVDFCGPKIYSVSPPLPFISLIPPQVNENWTISIFTNDVNDQGSYKVQISARLMDYPEVAAGVFTFQLVIEDPCKQTKIMMQYIEQMEYTIGQPATIQTFKQFEDSEATLINQPDFCGERRYFLFGQGMFLTLQVPNDPWHEDFKLVLFTEREALTGEYQVKLQVRLNYPFVLRNVIFKVKIQMPQIGPVFKPNLTSAIWIQKTREPSRWVFELPVIQLDDPMAKYTINLGGSGSAIGFVSLDARALVIQDISAIPAGFSLLKLTLKDLKQQRENSFQIQLTVKEAEPEVVVIPPRVLVCDYSLKAPVTDSEVVYQSGGFPLMYSWDRFELKDSNDDEECLKQASLKVRLAVFTEDSKFATSNEWLHYSDATIDNRNEFNFVTLSCDAFSGSDFQATVFVTASINEIKAEFKFSVLIKAGHMSANRTAGPPLMKLTKVSEMGVARLEFDSPLIVYDKPFDAFMIEPSRFLRFEVFHNPKSSYSENPEYIDSGQVTSMTVKSFKPWQIEIQLEFSNPLYISLDNFNLDSLLVTIMDETTFISAVDFVTTSLKKSSSQIEMVRQMNKPQKSKTDQVDKTQDAVSTALTSSSLALNLILGLSLKFLWGMVNTLQFVIYMDKWKVNWPPNATVALATVRKIALGEFVDTDALKKKLLDFFGLRRLPKIKSGRQLEIAAAYSGPQTGRIVAVALSLVALLVIIAALLYYALKSKYRQRVIDAANKTKQAILWNGVIRFYLQNFLKSSVAIATTYYVTTDRSKKPSKGSIVFMSLQALFFFLIVPILIYKVLSKNRSSLSRPYTKQRFGSLYLGVRHKETAALLQVFEFLAFRLMFVVLTFTLVKYPGILVNCFMLLNNFNIIYIGWVKPFDSKSQNNLELANCWMLHLISYALILLVNLVPGPEMEFNIGWVFIGLIGLIFAVNFCVTMSVNVREILWKLHLRKLKKEHEKRLIERAEEKLRIQETVQIVAKTQIQQVADEKDEKPNQQLIEAVLASNAHALNGSKVIVQIEEELARIDEFSFEELSKENFEKLDQSNNNLISSHIPVDQQKNEEEVKEVDTLVQQERVFDKKYDQFTLGNNYDFFILRELQEKKDREALAQPAQPAYLHLYQQDYGGSNLRPEQLIQNMFIPFKVNKAVLSNQTAREIGSNPNQQVSQAELISRAFNSKRTDSQSYFMKSKENEKANV